MKTIQIQVPDTADFDDKEAKMILATGLYEKGKLSLGQAAELCGLSKRAFMETMGDYGVSVLDFSADDLDNDIENAKNYSI